MKNNSVIKGVGVSSGYAIGRIHFHDGNMMLDKQTPIILVVDELSRKVVVSLPKNTRAVIASKGSIGCHGAGILREKKIPCIIRVSDLSDILHEGDVVEVSGETGTFHILEQYFTKNIDWCNDIRIEKEKVCYRPNRIYQRLRFDILKEGWERSPEYLFNLPRCKLELKKGIVFIYNSPNLQDLQDKIIEKPDEFMAIAKRRAIDIEKIKIELRNVKENICYDNLEQVYEKFIRCVELYHELLKYIYITQFVSDALTDEIVNLIENCNLDSGIKERYIEEKLKSEYVFNSIQAGIDPGVSTTWSIPCREPYIWEGEINWKRDIGDYQLIKRIFAATEKKGFDYYIRYSSLALLVPILYQLAEEHYFISSSICSFLNKFIEILANILVESGELEVGEDILDFSMDYVLNCFQKKIKEAKNYE